MATERIDIVITENGSRVVKRNLEDIGATAKDSSSALDLLKKTLAAVGVALVIDKVRQYSEAWSVLTGIISVNTKSHEEAVAVQERLFQVAQKTRSGLGDMAELYGRAARAGKELGVSQDEIIRFTEGVGKVLVIQHTSAQQASGSLLQLGQLLGQGKVRAQEFNSVNENLSTILLTVAKNVKGADGSIAKLREQVNEGKLSSKQFFDAFLKGSADLDKDFKKSSTTIGQGLTLINNALTQYVGELLQSSGGSDTLGKAARALADNIKFLLDTLIEVGKAGLVAGAGYAGFTAALKINEVLAAVAAQRAYAQAVASGAVVELGSAEATRQKAVAAVESATAVVAESRATVAAAEAEVAKTAATIAGLTATRSAIIETRADTVAKLSAAQATMAQAEAQYRAATAAGAQSFALAAAREATQAYTLAQAEAAAVTTELAVLGQQQARVSASLAAAQAAQATAQAEVNTAQAGAAAATAALGASQTKLATATVAAAGTTSILGQMMTKLKEAATAAWAAVSRLFVLINTNPLVVFITLALAAAAAIYFFGDKVKLGIDNVTTLSDLMFVLRSSIVSSLSDLGAFVESVFTKIGALIPAVYQAITGATDDATKNWTASYGEFYSGLGSGFAGVVRAIAKTLDAIGGLLLGLGIGIVRAFSGIPDAVGEIFKRMYNSVVGTIEEMINTVIDGVNKVRSVVGASLLDTVKFTKLEVNEKLFEQYGEGIADSINAGFEVQGNFLLNSVNEIFDKAQKIAQERKVIEGFNVKGSVDLTTPIGKPTKVTDLKELEKVQNALRALLDRIVPAEGALLELAKAEKTLNEAMALGLIKLADRNRFLELAKLHYRDIIDPLGKVNRELEQQTTLLAVENRYRSTEQDLMKIRENLLSQGIRLDDAQTVALRTKLRAYADLNEITAAQDQILGNSVEKRRQFFVQLQAIQNLLNDKNSGFTKGDAKAELVNGNADLFAGTQDAIDVQLDRFKLMYEQIEAWRGKDLISEQTAAQLKAKVNVEQNSLRLQNTSTLFGTLAQLQGSSNSKLAAIGKAAAMTQATIDGILAVQKALSSAPPPWNFALAAAVGVVAAANVAKIASSKGFAQGGYTGDGAAREVAGVVHGREFVVNAAATSQNRELLEQLNRGKPLGQILQRSSEDGRNRLQSAAAPAIPQVIRGEDYFGDSRQDAPRYAERAEALSRTAETLSSSSQAGAVRGGPGLRVSVANYGSPKHFEVQQISENEVRIIARDEANKVLQSEGPRVIARDFADPNSHTSKSIRDNLQVERNRG